MNTRSVNSAAGVILAAMQRNQTAAGVAMALESAGLLMMPETAAELQQTRSKYVEAVATVSDLVLERGRRMKVENALREENEQLRDRVAALEAERRSTNEALDDAVQELRARDVERPVNELTAAFMPVAVLREVPDGEHYAATHHEYRVGHDLPETGGVS